MYFVFVFNQIEKEQAEARALVAKAKREFVQSGFIVNNNPQ